VCVCLCGGLCVFVVVCMSVRVRVECDCTCMHACVHTFACVHIRSCDVFSLFVYVHVKMATVVVFNVMCACLLAHVCVCKWLRASEFECEYECES